MSVQTRNRVPPFTARHLEAICRVLGDTQEGLSGSEIGYLLQSCQIEDVDPALTKWKRLFNALAQFQNEHHVGNGVVVFIKCAMNPANYTQRPDVFRLRRDRLNAVLAFCGMRLREDGQVTRSETASTVAEALERADRLRAALVLRNVHPDVLKFCTTELLNENYFHAVFEAVKSITATLRSLTGLSCDGADLVHAAFSGRGGQPKFAINAYDTETLRMEQRGFVSLLIGVYGTIRNPLAHDPKIEWKMSEQDALDILTMISLIQRKLGGAHRLS